MKGNTKEGILADIGGRTRFDLITHPRWALTAELGLCYIDNYHSRLVPSVYLLGLLGIVILSLESQMVSTGYVTIAIIASLYFVELTLLDGLKRDFYLAHAVPALDMAASLSRCCVR